MICLETINEKLFYAIWRNEEIDLGTKELLKELVEKHCKDLYRRKRNKEIIHIGLDDPCSNKIGNQTLMFGPAGNVTSNPKIIISGISTSITAANGIAMNLKELKLDSVQAEDLRNIYLRNIYKGQMYRNFKDTLEKATNQSIFRDDFKQLFSMIEGKSKPQQDFNIMVTQLTLHGVATYYYDERHDRTAWSPPSTEIFNNNISEQLYNNFFVEKVLKERFLYNSSAKYLFIMGNDAYKKVKNTIEKSNELQNFEKVKFLILGNNFSLKNLEMEKTNKFICKIKHFAA